VEPKGPADNIDITPGDVISAIDGHYLYTIDDLRAILRGHDQPWLFYCPLAQQAALLRDDLLDPVDALLDDPALVDLVRECLANQ
jgi:S1-C subfamily serine protease